jgi:hypothetical protein
MTHYFDFGCRIFWKILAATQPLARVDCAWAIVDGAEGLPRRCASRTRTANSDGRASREWRLRALPWRGGLRSHCDDAKAARRLQVHASRRRWPSVGRTRGYCSIVKATRQSRNAPCPCGSFCGTLAPFGSVTVSLDRMTHHPSDFLTFSNGAVGNEREWAGTTLSLCDEKPHRITLFSNGQYRLGSPRLANMVSRQFQA